MDSHVLHNIIHRNTGNNSATCPVCNGSLSLSDKKALTARANEIMQQRQSAGMVYAEAKEDEQELFEFAELSSKGRNNLEDSSFAYIDSKGGRHLPIEDANHVRNALARFNQTHFESESAKSAALSKIHAAAKKFGIDTGDAKKAGEVRTMVNVMSFGEGNSVPSRIKLVPVGEYNTKAYGKIQITKDMLLEMKKHFEEGVRAGGTKTGLPIDVEHGTTQYKDAAAGWLKKIFVFDDGAYGDIDWTDLGKNLLEKGIYKFYSPEFFMKYIDPEHSFVMQNVMTGGGLVNKPMFKKDLPPVVMSEAGVATDQNSLLTDDQKSFTLFLELTKNLQIEGSEKDMDLKKILAKEAAQRSAEEVAFLAEHKGELTFDEAKKEGFAQDKEVKKTETTKVTAGEGEVVVKASELDDLRKMAAEGVAANTALKRADVRKRIEKIAADDKGVRIASDQVDKWTDRMMKMSEDEQKETFEMLEALPVKQIFDEKGNNTEIKGSEAGKQLDEKVRKYMEDHKGVSYTDALPIIARENPQLFAEHNNNLPVAKQER